MEIKKGIGVSPGVVISTAVVLDAEDLYIPERHVAAGGADVELERFHKAVEDSIAEIVVLREGVVAKAGKEIAAIFDVHAGILKDKSLLKQVEAEIVKQQTTAEFAVSVVMRRYAQAFLKMSDRYLSERVKDIHDIERRLLHNLIGQKHFDLAHLSRDVVIIAHDLLPSQTAALDRAHVKGFATDVGGRTSHTAIVARAMGIPAVVGLGNITAEVNSGDTIIIDGHHGVLIINPDEEQLVEHRET
jgi:phosphotransferase system enzyme I (PtsI)